MLHATYLKILDGRARFDGRASMLTWLFAVIRRTAADMRRRRLVTAWFSGHDEAAASADVYDAPTAATSPESDLAAKQARRRIADTLATLARRQREVLLLVYYHELTIEQAATAMGVSLGAARQHYARGKRALRARLEAQGVYP